MQPHHPTLPPSRCGKTGQRNTAHIEFQSYTKWRMPSNIHLIACRSIVKIPKYVSFVDFSLVFIEILETHPTRISTDSRISLPELYHLHRLHRGYSLRVVRAGFGLLLCFVEVALLCRFKQASTGQKYESLLGSIFPWRRCLISTVRALVAHRMVSSLGSLSSPPMARISQAQQRRWPFSEL